MKLKPRCKRCKSDNIVGNAPTRWNQEKQEWQASGDYGTYCCTRCGDDNADIEFVDIPE